MSQNTSSHLVEAVHIHVPSGGVVRGRQALFVREYPKDFDGQAAAVRAGYSPRSARNTAYRMLKKPLIQEALTLEIRERFDMAQVTTEMVISEFYAMARVQVADLFDQHGKLIPPHRLPAHVGKAVKKFKLEQEAREDAEGVRVTHTTAEVEMHSKDTALTRLGQYLNLWMGEEKDGGAIPVEFIVERSA